MLDPVLDAIRRIIDALRGVLSNPFKDCASSPALRELASALADYSDRPVTFYDSLLYITASQKEGV